MLYKSQKSKKAAIAVRGWQGKANYYPSMPFNSLDSVITGDAFLRLEAGWKKRKARITLPVVSIQKKES